MSPEDYGERLRVFQATLSVASVCASMLRQWPIDKLLRAMERAEALHPLPHGDPDRELIQAALPLWQWARENLSADTDLVPASARPLSGAVGADPAATLRPDDTTSPHGDIS